MAVDRNQRNQTKQVKQEKRFQNLTINYSDLIGKMTINDRISMLKNDGGRQLLSSLSPYQLAEMFPDYYKKQYPDVGKLLKSVTDSSFKPLSREEADKQMSAGAARLITGAKGKPSWVKRIEEETGKTISDPSAKIQLSDAKKSLLKEMESTGIKADDPRADFLGKLSDDDLKKAGIIKQTDNQGNTVFRRAEISQAEIQAEMQASAGVTKVISAGHGQPTVVEYSDGRIEKRSGDRAWRNNNPGNIEYGDFAKSMGAIGSDGRFAIFPTPEMGRDAKNNLLFESHKYKGLSIEKAMESYAPPSENDTNAYIKRITDALGLPKNTNLSNLTLDQRKIFLDAIQKMEGRSTGKVEVLREGLGLANVQQPTEEQLAEIVKKVRERQEGVVAKVTEVPQLPNGVEPGVVTYFNTLTDKQKQDFYNALVQQGGGTSPEQISEGTKRINEVYRRNPSQITSASPNLLGSVGQDAGTIVRQNLEGKIRDKPIVPKLQYSIEEAVRSVYGPGYNVEVYSGGQDDRKRTGSTRHDKGNAADIYITTPDGRRLSREEQLPLAQYWKHKGYGGIGLGMPNGGMHLDIAAQGQWGYYGSSAKATHLTPTEQAALDAVNRGGFNINEILNDSSYSEFSNKIDAALIQAKREGREMSYAEAAESVRKNIEMAKANERVKQAQTEAQTEAPAIGVNADGGRENINSDEIKAMPIKSLKGDNSVVVDKSNNPLFTMNTKEEQAIYNPKTRQVDVQPLNKTNPDTLGEKQTTEKLSDTENTTLKENQPPLVMPQSAMPQSNMRSSDTSLTITDDIFKDPSFKRAIAKTRFVDTGDAALGGHFGMANADLG